MPVLLLIHVDDILVPCICIQIIFYDNYFYEQMLYLHAFVAKGKKVNFWEIIVYDQYSLH